MTTTYLRPTNADTGKPTLAVYFTTTLCTLAAAHQYDLKARTDDLVADVRDHLDQLGIAIRPTIAHGRSRIVQEVSEGEEVASPPVIQATVMAFLTDAEPGDPRLAGLAGGFRSRRLDGAQVDFTIPTAESEAELEQTLAAERERGKAFVAASGPVTVSAEPAPTGKASAADEFDLSFFD